MLKQFMFRFKFHDVLKHSTCEVSRNQIFDLNDTSFQLQFLKLLNFSSTIQINFIQNIVYLPKTIIYTTQNPREKFIKININTFVTINLKVVTNI